METQSPSLGKVLTMALFALSCLGLMLFMWLSFGGTLPFAAQGYRIQMAFQNAQQLANQADVRIAGVNVGKVVAKKLDPGSDRTLATVELDPQYAPIHENATAILRIKTLLGETYVQLTPGTQNSPAIPDNGVLKTSHVQHAVQLPEIFDALDPQTRHAFQVWQQQLSTAVAGNDQNLNSVLGNLPTFTADANTTLGVLNIEHTAVVGLSRQGGTVFNAISANQSALRGLIRSAETTFHTTAANDNQLAATIHVFPTFLHESKVTLARLKSFALNTDPVLRELVPVTQQLRPTLQSVARLSPNLRHLLDNLQPLITVSRTGLPALSSTINGAIPMLGALGPFLEQLNPIINWIQLHQQLTSDFISQGASGLAAQTTAFGGNESCNGVPCGHYLRQIAPNGPETTTYQSTRDVNNRGNTYPPPLWLADPKNFSAGGSFPGNFTLPAWDCGPSGGGSRPVTGGSPACYLAPNLGPLIGQPQRFPHVTAAQYSNK
jgi:virulence factor Mce-like protein